MFGMDSTPHSMLQTLHLRTDHWRRYHQVNVQRICHIRDCRKTGLAFPTSRGNIYECPYHTQIRVVEGVAIEPVSVAKTKWKEIKEEDGSPSIPPLEAYPALVPLGLNHSGTSGAFSTASTQEDLPQRMKEMGGRTKADPKEPPPETHVPIHIPITCSLEDLNINPAEKEKVRKEPAQPSSIADGSQSQNSHRTTSAPRSPAIPTSSRSSSLSSRQRPRRKRPSKPSRRRHKDRSST